VVVPVPIPETPTARDPLPPDTTMTATTTMMAAASMTTSPLHTTLPLTLVLETPTVLRVVTSLFAMMPLNLSLPIRAILGGLDLHPVNGTTRTMRALALGIPTAATVNHISAAVANEADPAIVEGAHRD
jgi:hypothetical protein